VFEKNLFCIFGIVWGMAFLLTLGLYQALYKDDNQSLIHG
jgi:hypothetical protein